MSERFEIQGRRRHPSEDGPPREESRLAHAETLHDALTTAKTWASDGLMVWVYRVERGNGISPIYNAVRTFQPEPSTNTTPDHPLKTHNDSQAAVRVA
jgi:hypothetical protein